MKFLGLYSILAIVVATALGDSSSTIMPDDGFLVNSYQAFPKVIPARLTICYDNATLNNRFLRMPHSMDNLVALIRKVEAHPDTKLWTAGKMANTLIHRFRYDGIIDVGNVAQGVLPIITEKVETDKYRMQWRLMPGSASDFPESSLTQEEKCSLHWMLSYTVNHTARAEELSGAHTRKLPGSTEGDGEEEGEEEPQVDEDGTHDHHESEDDGLETDYSDPTNEKTEVATDEETDADAEGEVENKEDEETVPNVSSENQGEEGHVEEEGDHVHQTGDEDYGAEDAASNDEDDGFSFWGSRRKRQTSNLPQSAAPLEGGVVLTQYGTVAVGPVLAGIAAGMSPMSVKLKDFIPDPTFELAENTLERTLESPWVTTLAGDIAHTALLRVPMKMDVTGPRGQWNDTFCPREYRLSKKEHSLLTTAEFYGGMDGLLMSRRVQTWDSTSYLKLSAILEMYYSGQGINKDQSYRACNRINNYKNPSIIDPSMLKTQALNAALVMYARGIDGAPSISADILASDQIGRYINSTVSEINLYIANNANLDADYSQCFGMPPTPAKDTPATYNDLTFVIDQFNDARDIERQKELAAALANTMDIQVGGSRMEVVSGKDGTPYFTLSDTSNKADLACRISSLPITYSERRIADTLARTRARIVSERSGERSARISGANTRSIVFFVSSYTTNTAEKDKIKAELQKMLKETPDVHIMFATLASPEEFRPFVEDFDRDIIRMNNYLKYSDAAPEINQRLTTVGARLMYPSCSDSSTNAASLEAQFSYSGYLNPHTVQYFRLGPEHFYSSNVLTLRFKSTYGVAKYCLQSGKKNPGTGDMCKSAINADETVEFKITQPCGKMAGPLGCPSVYVAAIGLGIDDNVPCSAPDCHTPDQVKFTFTHEGLRCYGGNGSAALVLSNVALLFAALLTWLIHQ